MQSITIDYLLSHKFELSGLEEEVRIKVKNSGMFSKGELGRLPRSDTDRYNELNLLISDMIYEVFGNTATFSQKCNLNYETVRKYTRPNSGKTFEVFRCKDLNAAEPNLRKFKINGRVLLKIKLL